MLVGCFLLSASFVVLTSAYEGSDVADLIVYPEDPEPKDDSHSLPEDEDSYAKTTAGAESLGTLLAGRTEFPYLVDVRLTSRSQEDWVLGNLLSHINVLITCRWAIFYLQLTRERNIDWENENTKGQRWRFTNPELSVLFTPLYINNRRNEYILFRDYINARERQGERSVRFISTHPQCDNDPINFDFAVMTLSREIPPILPYIGYMPIRIDRDRLLITDFDLSHHEEKRIICHVASFGRDFANWKQHVVEDFKVRYRVYSEFWASCTLHYDKYTCTQDETNVPKQPGLFYTPHHCPSPLVDKTMDKQEFSRGFDNLLCFNSRARIGAVCDHDNGAPLVCEGKVFGIVTRGAHRRFCNDLLPVPFVVIKITPAADYYMNLARTPYTFDLIEYEDFEFINKGKKRGAANIIIPNKWIIIFFHAIILLKIRV